MCASVAGFGEGKAGKRTIPVPQGAQARGQVFVNADWVTAGWGGDIGLLPGIGQLFSLMGQDIKVCPFGNGADNKTAIAVDLVDNFLHGLFQPAAFIFILNA